MARIIYRVKVPAAVMNAAFDQGPLHRRGTATSPYRRKEDFHIILPGVFKVSPEALYENRILLTAADDVKDSELARPKEREILVYVQGMHVFDGPAGVERFVAKTARSRSTFAEHLVDMKLRRGATRPAVLPRGFYTVLEVSRSMVLDERQAYSRAIPLCLRC